MNRLVGVSSSAADSTIFGGLEREPCHYCVPLNTFRHSGLRAGIQTLPRHFDEGTTPGMQEVEFCQEQEPRVAPGATTELPRMPESRKHGLTPFIENGEPAAHAGSPVLPNKDRQTACFISQRRDSVLIIPGDKFPVHQFPERLQVAGTIMPVIDIVGMLPDIAGQ
jgi:hypothetical protein